VREFPAYEKFLPVSSHQIALADPALLEDEEIISSWFLGKEGADQVAKLSDMIQELSAHLGVKRVIFMGGSAGGFAALLYSYLHPQSVAIAISPQTRLQTYYSKFAETFRQSLWPSSQSFDDVPYADLVQVYADGSKNFPIVVVSARDTGHLFHQVSPFAANLPFSMNSRFVLDVGFWNILGHPNSVPRENYLAWLRAAIQAPELSADALCQAHFATSGHHAVNAVTGSTGPAYDKRDIAKAILVRDHLLKGEQP